MKKSAFVVLSIVACLALASCARQNVPSQDDSPYAQDSSYYDQPIYYDYYYRNRFFNWCFRTFRPQRYYTIVSQPGYRPGRVSAVEQRPLGGTNSSGRAGFGRSAHTSQTGSGHSHPHGGFFGSHAVS